MLFYNRLFWQLKQNIYKLYTSELVLDKLFSETNDIAAIVEIVNSAILASQKMNMAYILFQKTHVFKSALSKWDEKDCCDKTWQKFKTCFHTAYKALHRTGEMTLKETLDREKIIDIFTNREIWEIVHISRIYIFRKK